MMYAAAVMEWSARMGQPACQRIQPNLEMRLELDDRQYVTRRQVQTNTFSSDKSVKMQQHGGIISRLPEDERDGSVPIPVNRIMVLDVAIGKQCNDNSLSYIYYETVNCGFASVRGSW